MGTQSLGLHSALLEIRRSRPGWERVLRDHVQVRLRPPQAGRAAEDTHETILNIRQLRAGGGADSVMTTSACAMLPARRSCRAAVDGVGEAVGQVAAPSPRMASVTVPS